MEKIQLREICWAVAGDKGDISNIGLVVHNRDDYDLTQLPQK